MRPLKNTDFCSSSRKAKLLTTGILEVFRGLKFELDAEIEQKSGILQRSQRKEAFMSTPQHCPGFEQFKGLKSFICKCPTCGKKVEIFSDEFDKPHKCP